MRRSCAEAVEAGHRMATAAETAGLWFDDTARRSTAAAAALDQLQATAMVQASSLGTLTDQAGQALALLYDATPGKAWLEAVMARAPDLPAQLDDALQRAEAAAGRCETGATALAEAAGMPERLAEQVAALETAGGRLQVMTGELPDHVAGLGAVVQQFDAALVRGEAQLDAMARLPERFDLPLAQAEAQSATLLAAAAQLAGTPERLDAVMTRVDVQVAGLDEVARRYEAMTEWPARLDAALARSEAMAEAGQARVAQGFAALAGTEARLLDATVALEATTGHLGETLPQLVARQLDGMAAPLHRALAGLTEAGAALAPLTDGMAGLVQRIPQLDAAIDRAAEAPRQTAEHLAAVTAAIEAMIGQARPEPRPLPGRSVSARILGQLDAEAEPAVTAALLRLDGVETEVEQLLRQAEHLIEGPGGMAPVSPGLARHAPELLEGLEATIRQLQSVATTIAVVADRGSRRVTAQA